jgi:hypothetical protein
VLYLPRRRPSSLKPTLFPLLNRREGPARDQSDGETNQVACVSMTVSRYSEYSRTLWLLLNIILDCGSFAFAPNMRRKLTPYCAVTHDEDHANIPTSLNRSISKLENRAVIPHPSCGNLTLCNLLAPLCLFGLRSCWRRAFTLLTIFS